jgi:carbon monoxide dehydrogenase subunit G
VQHEHTEHVAAAPDAVFAAICDVRNLPRFVPQITAARPTDGERVEIDARYEGREQHGEATFHVDPAERRIEWTSAGGYRGWMSVTPDGDASRLMLFLETRHSSERDHDIAATLDAIRMLVESEV